MAKLDDFLGKKKETGPVLDLSKATANNKEEFRRLMDKVPDFKMKPEKVLPEHIKIRDKRFKFKSTKKDRKAMKEKYAFLDSLPNEMKKLDISELAAVPIDWKMLTTVRPKVRQEEQYFSRLVELKKMEIKTRAQEKRQYSLDSQIRKTKNKAGVSETRVVSCKECGEDFCNGKTCAKFSYDSFARLPEAPTLEDKSKIISGSVDKPKRKIKRRNRSLSKSKKKGSRKKSKSPSRRSLNRK